jgi:leucyl aminopeptidase
MQYSTTTVSPEDQDSDCLIIPVLSGNILSPTGAMLDRVTCGQLLRLIQEDLVPEFGNIVALYEPTQLTARRILAISCGNKKELSGMQFQKLVGQVAKTLKRQGSRSVCCYLDDFPTQQIALDEKICLAIQQFEASLYTFDQFKTIKKPETTLQSMYFHLMDTVESERVEYAIRKGIAVAQGMKLTKDLANRPANHATPSKIALQAQQLAHANPLLEVTIHNKTDEVVKEMGGFLAVAQGSDEPPQFVVIQYTPPQASTQSPIVLVGKGVTFDSGGISIKPDRDMEEMKFDMAGAASVLGTLYAVSQLEVPMPVIGLLPLTENLLSGSAVKPGDVITTLSGKTVEIINTDAEGRLILADALTYSRRFNPAVVIDIATLTGDIVIALGEIITGLMTEDALLKAAIEKAGETSVDSVWALPLGDVYQELINSNVADMSNLGHHGAGSITAGCFLARFTEGMRWAHLDIAGTAYIPGRNKTATGRPVPLLIQFILDYCAQLT